MHQQVCSFVVQAIQSSTLDKIGFKINPFNWCIAKKEIDGSQCTVMFYVDDNKISHKDPNVITSVLEAVSKYFGKLTITRGIKNDILGMNIKIKDQQVYIDIKDQGRKAIEWGKAKVDTIIQIMLQHKCSHGIWSPQVLWQKMPKVSIQLSRSFYMFAKE